MKSTEHPIELPRWMAPTDALFWYAEATLPNFRPIIGGLHVLGGRPDSARVRDTLAAMVAAVPRFRQRVREAPLQLGLPEWVDDPHFDADSHLRHLEVPAPGGVRELLDLCARLLATPLDRERPLWETYCIDGLESGRSACLLKLHHSMVDGVGPRAILEALTRPEPGGGTRPPARTSKRQLAAGMLASGSLGRLAGLAYHNVSESTRLAVQAAGLPLRMVASPIGSLTQAWRAAKGLGGVVMDASRAPIEDPLLSDVVARNGHARRLDVLRVPVHRLREISGPLEATINDVVLTVLAGTLGSYHRQRRLPVEELNCLVPMSLGADDDNALGNRVVLVNVVLPLAETRPEVRLQLVRDQTRAAKRDKRGAMYPLLVEALTMLPGAAIGWLARQSLGRVNVSCTNVTGVSSERFLAGQPVETIYPFASVVQGTPLVMALLSYAGHMAVGIDTDPSAIPDPQRIAELFEGRIAEMEALARRVARYGPA